jgi:signal recognition particle receptor subunit beta
MAIIRRKSKEIQCKIVYYGPGLGGKTTNLISIHRAVGKRGRGGLISINTAGDRTIFFDFLPMDLGTVRDMNIKFSLYTVPGQVRYNETRRLVLKGADGVVFVADSLEEQKRQNIESLINLAENLRDLGYDISNIPMVLQYNKRDLNGGGANIMPVEEMARDLNPFSRWPAFEASALKGGGVKETFKTICVLTIIQVSRQLLKD